tara:strand:+ start:1706 stop:1876 length:171 start_codon:yes stop_codon:yes gene_type:complete
LVLSQASFLQLANFFIDPADEIGSGQFTPGSHDLPLKKQYLGLINLGSNTDDSLPS